MSEKLQSDLSLVGKLKDPCKILPTFRLFLNTVLDFFEKFLLITQNFMNSPLRQIKIVVSKGLESILEFTLTHIFQN